MKNKIQYTLLAVMVTTLLNAQSLVWDQNYAISGSLLNNYSQLTNTNGIYHAAEERVLSGGGGVASIKLRLTRHTYSGAFAQTNAFQLGSVVASVKTKKIIADAAGNIYLVAGITKYNVPDKDCYIFSYSPTLNLRWVRLINQGQENLYGDITISSGSVYSAISYRTAGTGTYHIGIRKIDPATGNTLFTGSFTTGTQTTVNTMVTDANGNSYVGANIQGATITGILCRFTNTGTVSWNQQQANTSFNDLTLDNFGSSVYVCGHTSSTATVRRYNSSGALTASYTTTTGTEPAFFKIVYNTIGDVTVYGRDIVSGPGFNKTLNILVTQLNGSLSTVLSNNTFTTGSIANSGFIINRFDVHTLPNNSRLIDVDMWLVMASNGNPAHHLSKINASGTRLYSEDILGFRHINPVVTSTPSNTDYIASLENYNIKRYTAPAARTRETVSDTEGMHVTVYPNPANDYLNISGLDQPAQLQLTDLNGRLVFQQLWNPGDIIETTSLHRGTYLLTLSNETSTTCRKIVID